VVGNSGKDSLITSIAQHWEQDRQEPAEPQPDAPEVPLQSSETRRIALPLLPLDTQHIGSDSLLPSIPAEPEPQPDNPSRLTPFAANPAMPLVDSSGSASLYSRTRVQMKVQDGCDNRCTYCIVPYVRGKSRSRSIESIVAHVQRKARAGFQEIVL